MAEPKTLTFIENPESANLRFRMRTVNNWVLAFVAFVFWAFLMSPFEFRWVADAAAIALLFYLAFFLWEKRAIKITCPNCFEILRTNTPWVCGFRKCKNKRADEFPFMY